MITIDRNAQAGGNGADDPAAGPVQRNGIRVSREARRPSEDAGLWVYDGTGLVLIWKRLEGGKFKWPVISDGVMRLTSSQLSALLEGLDWTRVRAVRVHAPQATL